MSARFAEWEVSLGRVLTLIRKGQRSEQSEGVPKILTVLKQSTKITQNGEDYVRCWVKFIRGIPSSYRWHKNEKTSG